MPLTVHQFSNRAKRDEAFYTFYQTHQDVTRYTDQVEGKMVWYLAHGSRYADSGVSTSSPSSVESNQGGSNEGNNWRFVGLLQATKPHNLDNHKRDHQEEWGMCDGTGVCC